MAYSVASGELKLIADAVKTDGIIEAKTIQIGDQTLRDVSYNDRIASLLHIGERVALLLSPTRYVIALRHQHGEVQYSSEENRAKMEEKAPVTYYVLMGLAGVLTVLIGVGLAIFFLMYRTYLKRQDIATAMAKFHNVSF